jgi:hypothetical protein
VSFLLFRSPFQLVSPLSSSFLSWPWVLASVDALRIILKIIQVMTADPD